MQEVPRRPEDDFVDVVVADTVGAKLAEHMAETGRGGQQPARVSQSIQMAVWKAWGSSHVKRFQDSHGGGWYTSVSKAVDDEDLVAIIRTIHGRRMVCAVVESDEVETFLRTNEWSSEEARGLDPELEAEIARLEAAGSPGKPATQVPGRFRRDDEAAPQAAPEPLPGDPRLIVWWPEGEDGTAPDQSTEPRVERTTYGEAEQRVLRLLMKGAHVEVWADPKTPQIKVSL